MSDESKATPPEASSPSRRTALYRIGQGLMAIGGLLVAVPVVSYIFDPGFRKFKRSWISLGAISQFPEGSTRFSHYSNPSPAPSDGASAKIPCWVRHIEGGGFQVFYINCAHLGCPVRWFEQSKLFMCPCHGGVYYEDGTRASGPPPRGLYEYTTQVKDGQLYVYGGEIPNLSIPGKTPKSEVTPLTVGGEKVNA